MGDHKSLVELAAALADGAPVNWESAAHSMTNDADRALLAELQFIAAVTYVHSSIDKSPGAAASASDPPTGGERAAPTGSASVAHWGPLQIIELVGRGTFGDVYRAWDSRLDREVALKVLRRREREDDARASTAIQEGRLLARVRHPNVVTVFGAERVDGRVGVWMEYIHGRTLEEELCERGPFEVDHVIRIGIDLASAVSTVHRAGLIHRDVKAHNVMRDRDGRLVLTDFGAGIELEEGPDGTARELAGTPVCVAPEVLAGQPATPQSDIYSLGVFLYHLLTGTYPVRGRSLREVREAHASGTRVPLREERHDLPDGLVRIIDRALDPDPRQRYDTTDMLGAELAALVSGDGDARGMMKHSTGRRGKNAAPAGILLAVLGIGSWAVWRASEKPADPVQGTTNPTLVAPLGPGLLTIPRVGSTTRASTLLAQTFTVIEVPGATRTDLFEINDEGAIVGSYVDRSGKTHGFLLSEGSFTTIDVPDAVRTRPTGLDNGGTVVGDFEYADRIVHGFLLAGNAFTVIDVPGATFTRAGAINRAGDVVGDYRDAKGSTHGFFLSGGTFRSIDVPGATSTRAIGLDDEGNVVGDYQDAAGMQHGFHFAKNHFTSIDVPGAVVTQAFGVNPHGTIVGRYEEDAGSRSLRAFSFSSDAFTPIDVSGAVRTQAHAINASGSIVGSYLGGEPTRYRGFLLTP